MLCEVTFGSLDIGQRFYDQFSGIEFIKYSDNIAEMLTNPDTDYPFSAFYENELVEIETRG